ncbi:MAG: translocation/assembly module TamB domain-containing protein [Elusimicrobiota bacterium]
MKKIILFLSVIIVFTIGIYLFIRLEIFTTSLKYLAQSELIRIIGKPVKIEKVGWIPFNKLVFRKLSFEGFSCYETVVTVNLNKITKGLAAIEKISVNTPLVDIPAIKNIVKKKTAKSVMIYPMADVFINNGKILYDNLAVKNINLELLPKKDGFAVKSDGLFTLSDENNFSSELKLVGTVDTELTLKLKCELKNITFRKLQPLNGILNIYGKFDNFVLQGNLKSDEITTKICTTITPENSKIIIAQFSGSIPKLKSFAEKLLPDTTIYFTTDDTFVFFDGAIELPDTKLNLTLKQSELKISNLMVKQITTDLFFYNNEWTISSTATLLSGTVSLNGKLQKDNLNFFLTGTNLLLKTDYSSGDISFNSKITGTLYKPEITGETKILQLSILKNILGNAVGKFVWKNEKGKIKITGNNLKVNAEMDKTKLINCKINYDTTGITVSGKYSKLNFYIINFEPSVLKSTNWKFNNITGFVDLSGYIKNILQSPEIYAEVTSTNLTVNQSTTSLSGKIWYANNQLAVIDMKLGSELQGNIKISIKQKQTSGNLIFAKCNSNFILPFLGITSDILHGTLSGKINWAGSIKNPELSGTIAITRGQLLKSIPYNLIVTSFYTKEEKGRRQSKVVITEFTVQQQPSITAIRLSGELDEKQFCFLLKLNQLITFGRTVNADIRIVGEKIGNTIKYKIISDELKVDDISEKFVVSGIYDGEKIDFTKISWGDKLNGKLAYFIASNYLSANLNFVFNPEQFSKNITGKIDGKIIIRGDIKNPLALVNYNFAGLIYELPAESSGKIFVNRKQIRTEDTKLSINGATTEISGVIDTVKQEFQIINISASNLDTRTIYQITKSTLPVDGILQNVELTITDSIKKPQFTTSFSGKNILLFNKKMDSVNGKFSFQNYPPQKLVFSKADVKWADTQIKILPDTYINLLEDKKFKIIAEVRNLKLLPHTVLLGEVTLTGKGGEGGNWDKIVSADFSTTGLWINQFLLKDFQHHIKYHNRIIRFVPEANKSTQISGSINFSNPDELKINNLALSKKGKRLLYVNGFLKQNVLDFTGEGKDISLGDLLNLLNLKITASGNTNFNITSTGELTNPTITCLVNSAAGKIEDLEFDTASLFFQLTENILDLKYLKISQKNVYAVEGKGTTPLPITDEAKKKLSEKPVNISIKSTAGNLAIVPSIFSACKKAKGKFDTSLTLQGTLNKPEISGEFNISADEIVLTDIFKKLTDLKCELVFSGNKIRISKLKAFIDKEPVEVSGEANISPFTEGLNFGKFEFHLLTPDKSVPVIVNLLQIKTGGVGRIIPVIPDITALPPFSNPSKAKIEANVKLFGTPENWNIDGYLKLSDAKFTYPGEEGETGAWDFLKNANWNLKIIAGKNCWYENDFVSVETKGELLLHAQGSSPLVTGKVEALRGTLEYLGRSFAIREAVLEAEKSNLFLSGLAETETEIERRRVDLATHQLITEYLPETIILIVDRGPLENVKPRFSSKTNPQTDEPGEKLAAQAALGLADSKQKQLFSKEELSKIVDTLLTTPFVKSLLKRTGFIDRFAIKRETPPLPDGTAGVQPSIIDLYKGTKLQFGKDFARGFSAGYGIKFDEFENKLSLKHEIELTYRFKSGILFRTTQELERTETGDRPSKFFLEKYWRFGPEPEK